MYKHVPINKTWLLQCNSLFRKLYRNTSNIIARLRFPQELIYNKKRQRHLKLNGLLILCGVIEIHIRYHNYRWWNQETRELPLISAGNSGVVSFASLFLLRNGNMIRSLDRRYTMLFSNACIGFSAACNRTKLVFLSLKIKITKHQRLITYLLPWHNWYLLSRMLLYLANKISHYC